MTTNATTKNDIAWEKLFDKYKILNTIDNEGVFEITSKQIKEFREARLMTKFDHRKNLPYLFEQNKLAILPITRGSYLISQFDAYQKLKYKQNDIIKVSFPDYIESIKSDNITSEAMAINCAYLSGIFDDFIDDEELLPTVNGRMSSNSFEFNIRNIVEDGKMRIIVRNSQIEIDGGYEGLTSLTLIEAKNSISEDFLIRQLYYPFRLWSNNITKKVNSVFMVYSNGIFSLFEYEFADPDHYNSLKLIKQKRYSVEPVDIELDDILAIHKNVSIRTEPKVAFPQADSFKRVVNLCELLYDKKVLTRDEITYRYDFDVRQTNYYTDAGRYLGLIDKEREEGSINYFLTKEGYNIFNLKFKARQLKFVELILQHKVMNHCLKLYIDKLKMPTKNEIVKIMKISNLYNIDSETTFERRASTISGWINWILDLLD